jgi:hypothetical protein
VPRGDGKTYAAHDALALHLQDAFARMGQEVPIARRMYELRGRPLVLAPHRILEHPEFFVPTESILVNTEQFSESPSSWQRRYAELLSRFEVWDFSPRNIDILASMGVRGAKFLELGGTGRSMRQERVEQSVDKDIEVLFYGSLNDRRRGILATLEAQGVEVTCLHGLFGGELQAAISRAVIVLNVHKCDWFCFEMIRMLDLLPYGQCVVSESGTDKLLETRFNDGAVFSPREMLAEVCKSYLQDREACRTIGLRGQAVFNAVRQGDVLKKLTAA